MLERSPDRLGRPEVWSRPPPNPCPRRDACRAGRPRLRACGPSRSGRGLRLCRSRMAGRIHRAGRSRRPRTGALPLPPVSSGRDVPDQSRPRGLLAGPGRGGARRCRGGACGLCLRRRAPDQFLRAAGGRAGRPADGADAGWNRGLSRLGKPAGCAGRASRRRRNSCFAAGETTLGARFMAHLAESLPQEQKGGAGRPGAGPRRALCRAVGGQAGGAVGRSSAARLFPGHRHGARPVAHPARAGPRHRAARSRSSIRGLSVRSARAA